MLKNSGERMRGMLISVAMAAALGATAAGAKDAEACGAGMVCASAPQSVVAAMQAAGYQAKLATDNEGDPTISSSAAGYSFDVFFYGCDNHAACDSLQFRVTFEKDATNTAEFANAWNRDQRFSQMAVRKDGGLMVNYNVSTVGGLNQKNFADVLSWWASVLGELYRTFNASAAAKGS